MAIEQANQGRQHDEKGEFEQALQNYTNAIQTFLTAIKHEKNTGRKVLFQAKTKELFDRAERIKQHLGQAKPPTSPTGNGGAGGSTKPKQPSEKDGDAQLRKSLEDSIISESPNVRWEDVAGLLEAKKALRQAVVLPLKLPHVFTGKRQAWRGILLYGPPGTGKTFLAKAAASQCKCKFFSISSSSLMSKWLGESERLVRNLFEMARQHAPSIIYIDEIDSLCSARSESGGNDATNRVLTEFLAQMDGLGHGGPDEQLLVLAATNLPWVLDMAIRRRFEKRIYIPLPDRAARRTMFSLGIGDHLTTLQEADWQHLADATDGCSGADISLLCRAALMQGVAKIEDATHFKKIPSTPGDYLLEPCSPGEPTAVAMALDDISEADLPRVTPPVTTIYDFLPFVKSSRSVSEEYLARYEEFTRDFGNEGK
eukprot:TRINITY_DN9606_c1_g1_i1.p1 TRINITY_DN9606_c1_g1~~TRINITY_DN9606_c1_g1_i1.p1  ORF type:complete len:461 (+),score=101.73 TRINITY_DN9606_c1_g1_i1:108-1385(+)